MILICTGILLITISIALLAILSSDEESLTANFIVILIGFVGLCVLLSATSTDYVANSIMESYEKGEIVRKYTIIDSDTTYKWVWKDKNDQ